MNLANSSPLQDLEKIGSRYKFLKTIGTGGFGVIALAEDTQNNNAKVAIKFLDRLIGDQKRLLYTRKSVKREIIYHRILSQFPLIIEFHEAFLTDHFLCVVMEYAAHGNLWSALMEHSNPNEEAQLKEPLWSEDKVRRYFQQIILALDFSYKQEIANRDVKLENILMIDEDNIKLCDFGYSKHLNQDSACKTAVGTVQYTSPEVLFRNKGSPYDGMKSDVWSCGVALYIMLFGKLPFSFQFSKMELYEKIRNAEIHLEGNQRSQQAQDLLKRMMEKDPNTRLTFDQIRQHPWFLQTSPPDVQPTNLTFVQSDQEIEDLVEEAFSSAYQQNAVLQLEDNLYNTMSFKDEDDFDLL